jgi:hypothetical protein
MSETVAVSALYRRIQGRLGEETAGGRPLIQ